MIQINTLRDVGTSEGCMTNKESHLMRKYTPEERIIAFWNKVNKDGSIPAHMPHLGKCWEWTAGSGSRGYGSFHFDGNMKDTHRVSWQLCNGAIPDGLWVLHKCDNRSCVNPAHLFLGTRQDNVDDMISKGRKRVAKGEESGRHKLTENDVINIRQRYAMGDISYSRLAEEYGINAGHAHRIVKYLSWESIK